MLSAYSLGKSDYPIIVPRYKLKLPLGHAFGSGEKVDSGVEGEVPVATG
jgi:hypothetical protein